MVFVKSFQAIIFNFLWKSPDKIARTDVINNSELGSARFTWITRFYPWKAYLWQLLKELGGDFFLYYNYNINDYITCSDFYKEMLLWWSDLRAEYDTASSYKFVIGNNHEVRVNKKIDLLSY